MENKKSNTSMIWLLSGNYQKHIAALMAGVFYLQWVLPLVASAREPESYPPFKTNHINRSMGVIDALNKVNLDLSEYNKKITNKSFQPYRGSKNESGEKAH